MLVNILYKEKKKQKMFFLNFIKIFYIICQYINFYCVIIVIGVIIIQILIENCLIYVV
jgi:hypothetical protein